MPGLVYHLRRFVIEHLNPLAPYRVPNQSAQSRACWFEVPHISCTSSQLRGETVSLLTFLCHGNLRQAILIVQPLLSWRAAASLYNSHSVQTQHEACLQDRAYRVASG